MYVIMYHSEQCWPDLNYSNAPRNQLMMLSRHEMPRAYTHQVVKRKLKHQPTFSHHLSTNTRYYCVWVRLLNKRT